MKFNDTSMTSNMNKTVPSTITIHFIDGTTKYFEFEVGEIDPMTVGSKFAKFLAQNQILIQLVDRLLVIPTQSIKCLEFTPVPRVPSLSEFMIRKARPISGSQATNGNELATHPEHESSNSNHENASTHNGK